MKAQIFRFSVTEPVQALLYHPRLRLLRFAAVGTAVSIGYTITVVLLVEWLMVAGPAFASVISFLIWTPVSYVTHRDFTFGFVGPDGKAAARFGVSFVIRLLLSGLCVFIINDVFHWHYLIGVFLNWIILPLVNYIILDLWVFRACHAPAGNTDPPHRLPAKSE